MRRYTKFSSCVVNYEAKFGTIIIKVEYTELQQYHSNVSQITYLVTLSVIVSIHKFIIKCTLTSYSADYMYRFAVQST